MLGASENGTNVFPEFLTFLRFVVQHKALQMLVCEQWTGVATAVNVVIMGSFIAYHLIKLAKVFKSSVNDFAFCQRQRIFRLKISGCCDEMQIHVFGLSDYATYKVWRDTKAQSRPSLPARLQVTLLQCVTQVSWPQTQSTEHLH